MIRDGEIFRFDDLDRARYDGFPAWAPIEAIPGLFEDITDRLMATSSQISHAQSTVAKSDICLKSTMLHQALGEMLDLAGEEIVNAQLAA